MTYAAHTPLHWQGRTGAYFHYDNTRDYNDAYDLSAAGLGTKVKLAATGRSRGQVGAKAAAAGQATIRGSYKRDDTQCAPTALPSHPPTVELMALCWVGALWCCRQVGL